MSRMKQGKDLSEGDIVKTWFGRPVSKLVKLLPYTGKFDFICAVGVFQNQDNSTTEMSIESGLFYEVEK